MALAFPKTNAAALAPLGAAGLFWAWFGLSPKRAFFTGWLAGSIFFAINFWWFGETAGKLIAPFGFFLALGPAIGDAFFGFALPGAFVAFAAGRVRRAWLPLCAAAAFAFAEWLRSEGLGPIGVPFGSLAYTQVGSPLAPLAAYAGSFGVTFALCVPAAYAAYAVRFRSVRGSLAHAAYACAAVALAAALAWGFWPARTRQAPQMRVAAVQGNIAQSIKFTPAAFGLALRRYETLSEKARGRNFALVAWPETVITVALNRTPWLQQRFAALATSLDTELVVGSLEDGPAGAYNVLYFFGPSGRIDGIYRKRQLVPFAEHLPFAPLFAWIPWARNVSDFSSGSADGIVTVRGMRFAPLICWESAFSDLATRDVRHGAQALVIATDDAWFGTTAGPYQHAQIAQMRAIETGLWIVRAASTGISGLVAPDGRYVRRTPLNRQAVVEGEIGPPAPTLFDRLGDDPVAAGLALVAAAVFFFARRKRA